MPKWSEKKLPPLHRRGSPSCRRARGGACTTPHASSSGTEAAASARADELVRPVCPGLLLLHARYAAAPDPRGLPRRRGGPQGVLHTRLFYRSTLFAHKKKIQFFLLLFLMPVLCGAQSSSARQHHRTAVSACPQPCWCAAGSNKAAAASPPPPSPRLLSFLFCSSHSSMSVQNTACQLHALHVAPSVPHLHRCTSSASSAKELGLSLSLSLYCS